MKSWWRLETDCWFLAEDQKSCLKENIFSLKLSSFYLLVFLINTLKIFKVINGQSILLVTINYYVWCFGQLCNRGSLRDLIIGIDAHPTKHYHLGFGRGVSRSNLANANEKRDYQIFEQFAYDLITQARASCITDSNFILPIKGYVYAFNTSVIDLCLFKCILVA